MGFDWQACSPFWKKSGFFGFSSDEEFIGIIEFITTAKPPSLTQFLSSSFIRRSLLDDVIQNPKYLILMHVKGGTLLAISLEKNK